VGGCKGGQSEFHKRLMWKIISEVSYKDVLNTDYEAVIDVSEEDNGK
jgi:hypothetical protein